MALPCARSRMFIPVTLIVIFVSFCGVNCRYANEAEFTIVVKAYGTECFYQEAKQYQYLEIEYQVLDANLGSLNIDFSVNASNGSLLVKDTAKSDSTHRVLIPSDGALKICLDNTPYSADKTVYIEVFIEDPDSEDEHADDDDPFELGEMTLAPDNRFESAEIDKMRHRISKIYENLNSAQRYQEWQKAHEARHRNLIEHIFDVLNTLSCLQLLLMASILFIEVRVIEKFFQQEAFFTKLKSWFVG